MRPGLRALAVTVLIAMAVAAGPPATADEAAPLQMPAGEDSRTKPTDDGGAKPAEDAGQKSRLVSILGREVTNRDGDGGRVIDVLINLDGRSGAVVVEFGGFMGIGSRKVAVEWNALRFVREGNRTQLVIDVSREQVRDVPEYRPNEPPTVLTTR